MAIPPNVGLLYHRNVRVLDLFFSRILLEIAGATVSFVVLGAMFGGLGVMELPADMLGVLSAWFFLAWFGAALALIIGAGTAYSEVVERLWHPTAYLLFPISGAMFMVDWLPSDLQRLVLLLPMVHGVEMLREGYFGPIVRTHYDVAYLTMACMIMTLLGLALSRGARREVIA
jgi:capsular polysaccharide transport system permease protein